MKKQVTDSQKTIVRFVGGLGYFSAVIQWAWLALLYGPSLIENKTFRDFFLPHQTNQPIQASVFATSQPSPILVGFALVLTAIILVVTLVILIRFPLSLAKAGKKSTQTAAHFILPTIVHHRPLPQKRERILTAKIIIWVKFVGSVAPFVLLFGGMFMSLKIPFELFIIVGAVLAINSLVWFTLEYYLAKWFYIPLHKVS